MSSRLRLTFSGPCLGLETTDTLVINFKKFEVIHCDRVYVCQELIFIQYSRQTLLQLRMTIADIASMSCYVSPINPAVFPPHLTVVLLGIGLFFMAQLPSPRITNFNCLYAFMIKI